MKMKNTAFRTVIFVLALCVFGVSLAGCVFFNDARPEISYPDSISDASVGNLIAANCMPAALKIYAQTGSATSTGSGFYISSDGYLITNAHVVSDQSARLYVVDSNGNQLSASLVCMDESYDIAVLKATTLAPQSYLYFADSNDTENIYTGDTVYFIGNPSNLGLIVSKAMVSSMDVALSGTNGDYSFNSILLDGSVNHGNSGGALINANGAVVGVIYARMEGESGKGQSGDIYGIGCAIPSSAVMEYLDACNISYSTAPPYTSE